MYKKEDFEILKRALTRERAARKMAEQILEEKSRELFITSEKLKETNLRLEKLLKEKSNELQGVFENINDAYVVIDLFGNVLRMNNLAEKLFGYTINEKLNISELVYPDDANYAYQSFATLKQKGAFNRYTSRMLTKNKGIKWVQINASLVYSNEKVPIAAQGVIRDITQRKKLEFQKEEILKELQNSNEQLKEYAHIVSHDLKSPLRSIDALVSWIKEDNKDVLDNNTLSNFALIEETLETMDKLISDILEFAKVGSDKIKNKLVDLNVLIGELKNVLYLPKNFSLNVLCKLPVIQGDKTELKQLFQNLISNSVKFIDKKEGIINIDFYEKDLFYVFSVEDNGIGIEEKYHQKIFQIFQTLNKSKESSGIGLSIVKKIVNLYQGDIWLESKPTIGSKFIFTLKK